MSGPTDSGVVVTDPKPVPADQRCPRCRAPETKRIVLAPFGTRPWSACGVCGHEFDREVSA